VGNETLENGEAKREALLAANVKTATYTDLTVNNDKTYYYAWKPWKLLAIRSKN
jgi:hypothetical protein